MTTLAIRFSVSAQTKGQASTSGHGNWKLTWSDEFDGKNGSLPDSGKWTLVTGGNGWGNRELEYYTARAVNVRAEPSVSAPIAANLKRGAQVSVLERRGNWDRVEVVALSQPAAQQTAAQQGWVYSSYLTDTDPGAS